MGLFGNLSGKREKSTFEWKTLRSQEEVDRLIEQSKQAPCVIVKHSTRCSISFMVKKRLEQEWNKANNAGLYLLDLLQHRQTSDYIAQTFDIRHESPQVIILKNGKVAGHGSHHQVTADLIEQHLH